VDRLALEVFSQARNMRKHGFLIAVVSGAQDHPARVVDDTALATVVGRIDLDPPPLLVVTPVCADNLALEANALVEVELCDRVLQVPKDALASGNGVAGLPWVELEAERVQVRVGADAGVLKLGPGAAEFVAGFENGKGCIGQLRLHAVCGIDA
jgi:hypothetical protein